MAAPPSPPSGARREPFLAWPDRRNLRGTLALSALCAVVFAAVFGGSNFIADHCVRRFEIPRRFGFSIPWVPGAAPVYLSINLLLGLAPFVFRRRGELTPLFMALVFEIGLAGVFFLIFPMDEPRPPRAPGGFFGLCCRAADFVNLGHNQFPSLHVALTATAAWAYGTRCGRLGRGILAAWAGAIAASTLLIHAHDILDVAGGLGLAAAGTRWVYPSVESRRPALAERPARMTASTRALKPNSAGRLRDSSPPPGEVA